MAPNRSLVHVVAALALPAVLSLGLAAEVAAQSDGGALPPTQQLSPALIQGPPSVPAMGPAQVNGLTDAPLAATPLSAGVLTSGHLAERGVESLSSAIRDLPAATDSYNTFGYPEALQVRGFILDEKLNYRRDGLAISSHAPIALENKEAIEVLYGASGILSGVSAPGGLVNYALKRPTDVPLRAATLALAERGSIEVAADLGGRLGDGATVGYRINVAAEHRRPEVHDAWSERGFGSALVDWRLAPATVVQFDIEQHDVREISVPGLGLLDTGGVGYGTTLPPPLDPRLNLNHQPWTLPFESRETVGSLRLEQRLGADWRLTLALGLQRVRTNDRVAFPDGCSNQTPTVYPGLCANYDVDVYDFRSNGERRLTNDAQATLHGRLRTGPLVHELTLGVDRSHYSERYPVAQTYNLVGTINALAPTALPPDPEPLTLNTDVSRRIDQGYLFDAIRLGAWSAWIGARANRIAQDSAVTDGSEAVTLAQHPIAPFAALGYEPWPGGFAYVAAGSGIEVFSVPNRPLQLANPGAALPAIRSRQVEIGFKQTGSRANWSVALFEITRPTPELLAQGTGLPVEALGAERERHRGIDLSTGWRVADDWLAELRAEILDARIEQPVDPRFDRWHVTNVAPLTASARAVWSPAGVDGLSIANLLVFSGRKPVLPADLYDAGAYEVSLPAYWQWDASFAYRTTLGGLQATWLGGIDNVTDRHYWREAPTASWGATYLFPAAPRTFRIALQLAW